ncbi:MAG: ATP-binding protein, partial [Bacteroidota bacterium]
MGYKRFALATTLRVILLFAVTCTTAFVLFRTDWNVTAFLLCLLIILLLLDLIRYVNKTNRDLRHFFESIRHNDFTASFTDGQRGGTYRDLNTGFNDIISRFQQLDAEKESHFHYLNTVIEHIRVAVICFD